uniref:Uncharacterized protein LOC101494448 isoform X1 n=2 Tax=Cicer arietinum TaxID=3827 RepID=A0A3Q7YB52_CICAR|nr:uncharacterized protein LOC101494448 isoform X1 [Cicer arietinum]
MEKEGLGSTEKGVWDGESVFVVARFACIIIKLNINIYLWRMNACAQISRYSKNSCQLLYFENQNRDTCIQIFSSLLQGLLSFPFILQSTTIHYLSKLLPVATFMNQKNGNYFGVLYYEIIHLTKLSHSVGSSSCCRGLLLQRFIAGIDWVRISPSTQEGKKEMRHGRLLRGKEAKKSLDANVSKQSSTNQMILLNDTRPGWRQ